MLANGKLLPRTTQLNLITKMPTIRRQRVRPERRHTVLKQIIPPCAQINHVFAFQPQALPRAGRQNVLKIGGGFHVPNRQICAMCKKPIRKIQIPARVADGQHLNLAWHFEPS